ncbi:BTB/POZ domain-containing protein [Ditylenchus destructor]|nr:BTB/POZ domain-containing protein [Ditylenchus destructor]
MTFFSTKIEWRIEHFDKAMRFYDLGQSISGKTFVLRHFQVLWQLVVYPHGKSGYHSQDQPNFSLRLIGFQTSDGSLCPDKTKVGAKSFPAHKCILGQWSEVFRNMFSLPTEEAESGIVEITDFGPDAISAMLEYMYTGAVNNDVTARELLALADKYAVFPLKEMCEVFLASKITTTNFLQIVTLADRYFAAKLKKACVNRLAIDGRAALQSQKWVEWKSKNKDLADELLELLIKDHPCFADVQDFQEAAKDAKQSA